MKHRAADLQTGALPRHLVRVALAGILLVGAALRCYQIDQPLVDAFSWRQSSTAMMAENFYRTNWNIFYPEVNWTGPGPNYQGREFQTVSYLAALLYTIVGQQDWVGRGVAVAFGLWGIVALFLLVRLVWDEERALASAAVMAVLPGSVFIDRSFLPDPAMVALVTTSLWLFVGYLRTEHFKYLVLAAVIGAWGFLTKIPGLIIGLPMLYAAISTLGMRGVLRRDRIAAFGLFALLTLGPVVAYYLWARHLALSYPPHHFAGAGNWVWDSGIARWIEQNYFLPRLAQRFRNWMWTPLVIALVLIGLFYAPARQGSALAASAPPRRSPHGAPWLFHWWLAAGLVYYLLGAAELVGNPWNFHILNPAAAALAGHAVVSKSGRAFAVMSPPRRQLLGRYAVMAFIVGAIALVGQLGLRWMYHPYAAGAHKLGLALREVTAPGDLVITMAGDLGDPSGLYYSRRRGWVFPPARPGKAWGSMPEDDREAIQLFDSLRAENGRYLGIVRRGKVDVWQDHPIFADHLERTCASVAETADFYICRIVPAGGLAEVPAMTGD
jgi:hypothetical protein